MPERQSVRLAGRLFDLVSLVTRHPKKYTAPKLAEYFHTSVRTVRRDIRLLEDIGIRVESEPSGGYFVMKNLGNMPEALTESDRLALEIVPWLLRGTLFDAKIHPLIAAYEGAMDKVFRKPLSPMTGDAGKSSEGNPSIVVDLARPADRTNDGVVLEVLHGIRNARTLQIEYKKVGADDIEIRHVNPYYLVPWQNSLYVIGFCHLRQAFRTFKIGRMREVHCTANSFARDLSFSLPNFLKSAWGIDQSGLESDVTLAFQSDVAGYAQEDIRAHRVISEEPDDEGRYIVHLKVHLNAEFIRFVLQYGASVEVLHPSVLRQQMRVEVERLLHQYQN